MRTFAFCEYFSRTAFVSSVDALSITISSMGNSFDNFAKKLSRHTLSIGARFQVNMQKLSVGRDFILSSPMNPKRCNAFGLCDQPLKRIKGKCEGVFFPSELKSVTIAPSKAGCHGVERVFEKEPRFRIQKETPPSVPCVCGANADAPRTKRKTSVKARKAKQVHQAAAAVAHRWRADEIPFSHKLLKSRANWIAVILDNQNIRRGEPSIKALNAVHRHSSDAAINERRLNLKLYIGMLRCEVVNISEVMTCHNDRF